tara:strand:+ start:647 stop:760 length:114 start_codon:yes stop_codon:yes gene_type:complete
MEVTILVLYLIILGILDFTSMFLEIYTKKTGPEGPAF